MPRNLTRKQMGRAQVQFRATHGRGRGRGRGDSAPRRGRGGGRTGGGGRPLESNAYRFDRPLDDENDNEADDTSATEADGEGNAAWRQRQFFASAQQTYREPSGTNAGSYFQTQAMKQWDADQDGEADRATRVLDFGWIATQLADVPPAIRYRMDPKYCVDFTFESQEEEEVQEEDHVVEEEAFSASHEAEADSELDRLLALSRPSAASASTAPPTAVVQAQQQANTVPGASHAQLEDWLDDVLDM